jgi:pimeloyl-ACP methyl ester carboxylesterase
LDFHYLDWGNPEAAPVVLLHGHTGNARTWDMFVTGLRGDYHVLAIDQRGHGDSSWAKSYRPEDYVADFEGLVIELQLKDMALVGHSMGGIIAVVYTARHPDMVNKLVIGDIGPEMAEAGIKGLQERFAGVPESFSSEDEALRYLRGADDKASGEFLRRQLAYAMKYNESGRLVFKYDPALLKAKMGSPQWLWEYLERIVCPALVAHGAESDILLPGVVREMTARLAFGTAIDIERAGHRLLEDNPEAFAAAVRRFLRR